MNNADSKGNRKKYAKAPSERLGGYLGGGGNGHNISPSVQHLVSDEQDKRFQ